MEVEDTRYQELLAAETRLKEVEPKLTTAEDEAAKVPALTTKVEELEIAKKSAEDERDEEKGKREGLEEAARADTLASERLAKLGGKFKAKLPESITTTLGEQAKSLKDEDWTARLEELAELTGVKHDDTEGDEAAEAEGKGGAFSREEVARSGAGAASAASGGDGGDVSPAKRSSVVAGLAKQVNKAA